MQFVRLVERERERGRKQRVDGKEFDKEKSFGISHKYLQKRELFNFSSLRKIFVFLLLSIAANTHFPSIV